MKEHPTDKDLVKEGTREKVGAFTAVKALVAGLLADVPRVAARLRGRFRR